MGVSSALKTWAWAFLWYQTWEFQVFVTSEAEFNKLAQRRGSERQKIIGNINKYESNLSASNLCFIMKSCGFAQLGTPPTHIQSRSDSYLLTLPILNYHQKIIRDVNKYESELGASNLCFITCGFCKVANSHIRHYKNLKLPTKSDSYLLTFPSTL